MFGVVPPIQTPKEVPDSLLAGERGRQGTFRYLLGATARLFLSSSTLLCPPFPFVPLEKRVLCARCYPGAHHTLRKAMLGRLAPDHAAGTGAALSCPTLRRVLPCSVPCRAYALIQSVLLPVQRKEVMSNTELSCIKVAGAFLFLQVNPHRVEVLRPCPALPCPALSCPALPCRPSLPCPALFVGPKGRYHSRTLRGRHLQLPLDQP